MKLKVNYDLLNKIEESKKGVSLNKIYKNRLRNTAICIPMLTPFYILDPDNIGRNLIYLLGFEGFYFVTDCIIDSMFKDYKKKIAKEDLLDLIRDLEKLGVLTNYELLQSSEVITTNYKVTLNKHKIPAIKEAKYINVNLRNGYSETIMQEHNIMSRYYDIYVKEIEKKKVFKLAKNNT